MVEIGDGEPDVDAVVCLEMGEPGSTVMATLWIQPEIKGVGSAYRCFLLVTLLPSTSHSGHE